MSSQGSGPTIRQRGKSRIVSNRVGYITPDFLVQYNTNGAPAITGGTFIWTAPAKCRVVAIREVHETAGGAASKIYVRKHVAGQTAAAAASTSGANIVDLVSGGIAADSAARTPQSPAIVTTTSGTPAVAYAQMSAGDKLAVVTAGTWVGNVDIYVHWTA